MDGRTGSGDHSPQPPALHAAPTPQGSNLGGPGSNTCQLPPWPHGAGTLPPAQQPSLRSPQRPLSLPLFVLVPVHLHGSPRAGCCPPLKPCFMDVKICRRCPGPLEAAVSTHPLATSPPHSSPDPPFPAPAPRLCPAWLQEGTHSPCSSPAAT